MADGVGDDAVSRAHRHRRESEGLSVADLLARHGRDATTPGHRHQHPGDEMDPSGGPGRAPSLAPDGDTAGSDTPAGPRGRRGSIGPITAPNLPAGPYGGYQPDAPAGRYAPDSSGERYIPYNSGERYVPDAPIGRYAPEAPAERYVPNDQRERDPLDKSADQYPMDGPTGRYPLVDRLPSADPHGYGPTASGPSSPVPLPPDEPPSSFAEFDAEPPPDEPRGDTGAIWSSGPAPAAPAGWPAEPDERAAGRADHPFRPTDRGRSAITESRPSSHDSLWSSPNPSTNLFAQLGSAEPDDRPTEVVPRVDDGAAPGNDLPGGLGNGVPGGPGNGIPGGPGNGVPGGPVGRAPGGPARGAPGDPADGASGGPAGGVAAAGGAVLGAAAAVGAAGGLAGAAGGAAGAALGGAGAAGAAAGTVALGAVAGTAAIRPGRHYRPDVSDPDAADPGTDEPASGEQGFAGPPPDHADQAFAEPPAGRAGPGFDEPTANRAGPGLAQPPADDPAADRARPAADQPEPVDQPAMPAHEEYDPGAGAGDSEKPAVVNAPPALTQDQRTRQIDASLTRLTAIHAGLGAELSQRVSRRADDEEEPAAPEADEPTDDGPPPPRHPTLNRVARIAALVAAAALFVVAASGWGMQIWLNTKLRPVTALDADAETVVDAAAQRGDRNYLFVGLPPGGREARPATVTLAHLDAARERLVLVGFPEELVVDRPSCDRWDNTQNSYPGGTTPAAQGIRLFEAYAEGGPRCLTKTVQKLTGLSVNHYTGLDLAALPAMVDAVHGVPLCQALSTSPGPAPESGPTVLTGDKALAFVRGSGDQTDDRVAAAGTPARTTNADDQLAIRHQQVFLAALLNKATSDGVLNSPGELDALVSAFGGASYEDNADLGELTPLAKALHRIEPAKVLVVTAPPSVPSGRPGEVDPGALYAAIRGDKALPGETVADKLDSGTAKPEPTLIPSSIRVTVRNASKRAGLANEAADSLRTLGFVVAGTGDAPASPGGRTIIRYSPDRAKQAAVLGDAVPSAIVEPAPPPPGSSTTDPADPLDPTGIDEPSAAPTPAPYVGPSVLELVLGDRFDGQVRVAPAPEPSAGASVASLRAATHTAPTCG
ncbi:hypothetical protein GCM10023321_67040 [Pseudonocardia eucalypti]|uniref:LytR family transcriptional attenuator n=1 Tax=Pseudonocardia eucalypti TaxID=648755 RepID=A0ABP9R0U8_9PSEU|nr:LCP family protein required for cell wall assembly [Pseudonocardia eucalypti]